MLEGLRRLFTAGGEPPEVGNGPVGLADILDRGWLELFYQPKIELKTKRLVGAEGLVRARHPTQGLAQPGDSCLEQARAICSALPNASSSLRCRIGKPARPRAFR